MKYNKGEKLINDLLLNPSLFQKQRKGYSLLKEFLKGMPSEKLKPLLESEDIDIHKPAMSIASELGEKVCKLMPYIMPFINSEDEFIKYCVLECILACGKEEHIKDFIHLVNSININNGHNKHLEMLLLYDAEKAQLEEGFKLAAENKINDYKLHQDGLFKLINKNNSNEEVIEMLNSFEPLTQRYGAIISARMYESNRELINHALLSTEPYVKAFAELIIDLHQND